MDELSKYNNGIKNIILVNGHSGNTHFLRYFCEAQCEKRKKYVVVLFESVGDPEIEKEVAALRKSKTSGHAGEIETSMIMSHRPDLAHVNRAGDQSSEDLNRLDGLDIG